MQSSKQWAQNENETHYKTTFFCFKRKENENKERNQKTESTFSSALLQNLFTFTL